MNSNRDILLVPEAILLLSVSQRNQPLQNYVFQEGFSIHKPKVAVFIESQDAGGFKLSKTQLLLLAFEE